MSYKRGTMEQIARINMKACIKTVIPQNQLKNMFSSAKDHKDPPQGEWVYMITCECGLVLSGRQVGPHKLGLKHIVRTYNSIESSWPNTSIKKTARPSGRC